VTHTKVIPCAHSLSRSLRFVLFGASLILVQSQLLMGQGSRWEAGVALSETPVYMEDVKPGSTELLPSAPESSRSETASRLAVDSAVLPVGAIEFEPEISPRTELRPHSFWDRENRLLFAANGAIATADFFTTRANLAKGGRELNPFTRVLAGSTPGLVANFALETGGLVSLSYLCHKTGHHKLERIIPIMNLGASAGAVAYNLRH